MDHDQIDPDLSDKKCGNEINGAKYWNEKKKYQHNYLNWNQYEIQANFYFKYEWILLVIKLVSLSSHHQIWSCRY